jgi:hypothetical protein
VPRPLKAGGPAATDRQTRRPELLPREAPTPGKQARFIQQEGN